MGAGAGVVGAGVVGAVPVPPGVLVVDPGHRKIAIRIMTMTTMMPMTAFLLMGYSLPLETTGGRWNNRDRPLLQ